MTERGTMVRASMTPNVTWRPVDPADVLTGLGTLNALEPDRRIIAYRGESVDTLLRWAGVELDLAENASTDDDRHRHATQAVGHAKRTLDCLFDAYLERDFLDVRLPPRAAFSAKLALLKTRLGQALPWRLIPAVVAEPRDVAEHERKAPTVKEVGIAVDAARVIAGAMIAESDPLLGPALLGKLAAGWLSGPDVHHMWVTSFPKSFAWVWRCADGIPRLGIGTASADDTAEVIFADLSSFTEEQHLNALRMIESAASSFRSSTDERTMRQKMQLAGLDQPK